MYLTTGDIIAVCIALVLSMALLFIVTFANIHLLNENRFLRERLRAWRKSCQHNHTEVPF
jgi:protein-S-isoprenylcysteine O-methyltransferase Ste14